MVLNLLTLLHPDAIMTVQQSLVSFAKKMANYEYPGIPSSIPGLIIATLMWIEALSSLSSSTI